MKILASNPDYAQAWAEVCACESEYNSAVNSAKAGANNWSDINSSSHKLNAARSRLYSIPQYIEVEVHGLETD